MRPETFGTTLVILLLTHEIKDCCERFRKDCNVKFTVFTVQ